MVPGMMSLGMMEKWIYVGILSREGVFIENLSTLFRGSGVQL